jgi:S-adenosyl methyltransferase
MVSGDIGRTAYIHADIREPEQILANPVLTDILDLTKPVRRMLVAKLMLIGDQDDPCGKAGTLKDAMASSSYVAISHHGHEFNPEAMAGNVALAAQGGVTLVPRVRAEAQRFFRDWGLVEPGVVPVMAWHPDGPPPTDPDAASLWAGVARNPRYAAGPAGPRYGRLIRRSGQGQAAGAFRAGQRPPSAR